MLPSIILHQDFSMLISRTTVAKSFYVLIVCSLIMYLIIALYSLRYGNQSDLELINKWYDIRNVLNRSKDEFQKKYILFDTESVLDSFMDGEQLFKDQCPQSICYITTNKKLLGNKDFDAVVINVTELSHAELPVLRPKKQRYVLYAMEPSDHTPICRSDADNYFDYTWSYKLSSDIVSPLFVVQDLNGVVVAPSLKAKWNMSKISSLNDRDDLKFAKKNKRKAVAMLARSCNDDDGKFYAYKLREALKYYYLKLHSFKCGNKFESSDIPKAYYFILVTSDSSAQDYVTDKILKAYLNNAVPIIRANADLTKFLPPGSYIDARLQTPDQIAAIVSSCTSNRTIYREFFKWRNFYTIRKRRDYEGICRLCSLLHSGKKHSRPNIREWWENGTSQKCGKD